MNTNFVYKNIYIILIIYICMFISLYLYYAFIGYNENIPNSIINLQLYFFASYFICLLASLIIQKEIALYAIIFIYSILSSSIVRYYSWSLFNEPFFGAIDSIKYDYLATSASISNFSYKEFINYSLLQKGLNIDDLGMYSIVYWIYNLFGSGKSGQNTLMIINSFLILFSSIKMNKIIKEYGIQKKVRYFSLILFGCFPFLSITAAVGLKENFFILLIINSFYYILKYKNKKSIYLLLKVLFFIFLSLFFRTAISIMLLITLIIALITTYNNRKKIIYMILLSSIVGLFLIDIIIESLFGISLQFILGVSEARTQNMGNLNGSLKWILQGIACILGPFPNFNRAGDYAILHSSGLLLKMIINILVFINLVYISCKFEYKKYSLLVYYLMNMTMLILSAVAFDMRYHITLFPLIIPLFAIYIQKYKITNNLILICILVPITLTILYNLR